MAKRAEAAHLRLDMRVWTVAVLAESAEYLTRTGASVGTRIHAQCVPSVAERYVARQMGPHCVCTAVEPLAIE